MQVGDLMAFIHVYHADRHVLPDAVHDLDHAAPGRRIRRAVSDEVVADRSGSHPTGAGAERRALPRSPEGSCCEFRNVSFHYPNAEGDVIRIM